MSDEESADAVAGPIVPRNWDLLRPCPADLAMVVAGFATLFWWSTSPRFREFLVVVALWFALWTWRLRCRGWWIWGSIAAILTTVIVLSGQPHWALRTAASCLSGRADQAFDSGQVFDQRESRGIEERESGRCGALRWSDAYVVDVGALDRTPPDESALGFVVVGAGPPYLDFIHGGRHGYVYSPERAPASCMAAVGRSSANNGFHDCRIEPVFGDWYWFVGSSALD